MKDLLKHSAVAAAWLALWQILYLTLGRAIILPSPLSVARRMAELIITLPFWRDIAASLIRILIGYLSALVTGVAIGILTAKSKVMDAFLSPISRIVRATPVASFIMLLFLFLTKEHIPIVTSFLMVMPVVWSNVYEGITGTDVKLLEMARVFRLSFSDTLRIPARHNALFHGGGQGGHGPRVEGGDSRRGAGLPLPQHRHRAL